MGQISFRIYIDHNYGEMRQDLARMQDDMDFGDVAEEGIRYMQLSQIGEAPIGSGPGVHGRIPRSIEPYEVNRFPDGSAEGISRTRYGPAIFTSLGTGKYGPEGKEYFIPRPDWGEGRGIMHPGIRGTQWWERGANKGAPLALAAFKRKVDTIMRLRGMR